MNVGLERPGAFGFGVPAATMVGQAVAGIGAFSEAAYRQSDQIRRSIVVPPAAPRAPVAAGSAGAAPSGAGADACATFGSALAGFVASPAGHAALERLASAGNAWLERALGVAGAAEQLALPLA